MGYFRELPNLEYQSFLDDRKSSNQYVRVKNLFRRIKLRDDIQNIITIFDKYQIQDGARPDTVADEVYGRPDYDWVILLGAGIINVRNEWPLSDRDIYRFAENKYGVENLTQIHHYETKEIKDLKGRLILPAGQTVDRTFSIPDPDDEFKIASLNPVVGITNYEYEIKKNNEKRSIYVLKKTYLQQFINDMRKIMRYDKSSQYITDRLIKTENTRNTIL